MAFPIEEGRQYTGWLRKTKKRGIGDLRNEYRKHVGSDPPKEMGKSEIIMELTQRQFPNLVAYL